MVNKKIKLLPIPVILILTLSVISAFIYIGFSFSITFSDFVMKYLGTPVRFLLAKATNLLPFSLAEFILMSSPIILLAVSYIAIKKYSHSWRATCAFMIRASCVLLCIWIIFVLGFAGGYKGTSLDKKLSLERKKVSADELFDTAVMLLENANKEAEEVLFMSNGESLMPYSFSDMTEKLNDAFASFADKNDFVTHFGSSPKQVVLSEPWTYTHIAGVYTFFTGESNINMNFPDYTLPFTTAHEMAHQRGISKEDEANFVAFLVCIESDDHYIRYSAYQNLYEYVRSALYSANKEKFAELADHECSEIKGEMRAYSLFFDKYKENIAANVSGQINNSYLQSQGTPGTKSYGMVVDLAVAYFRNLNSF